MCASSFISTVWTLFYSNMTVSLYKTRIKEKWWFSQCGRTWLVCRKQLNTSGVTLNADLGPKMHQQTPITCTYGIVHIISYTSKLLQQRWKYIFLVHAFLYCHSLEVPFSLLKKGVTQYFWKYSIYLFIFVKGLVHPKTKILSSITPPHFVFHLRTTH